jgi:hypothetical protein
MRSLMMTMKNKKVNPNECFQCGKPVAADQPDSIRWEDSEVVYCNEQCWVDRRAETERMRLWTTAVHEAGHVLGARLGKRFIKNATIVPSKKFLGRVRSVPDLDKPYKEAHAYSIEEWLLGHAAVVEFGIDHVDGYGHSYDYEQVAKMLKEPIRDAKSKAWAERTGIYGRCVVGGEERKHTPYTTWDIRPRYSYVNGKTINHVKDWQKSVRVTKSEWKPEFDKQVRKARRLAKQYRAYIERVAELLLQHETLTDDMIPQLGE